MTRINSNVSSLRGLRSLNRASDLLGTSLQRLSTGLKINSGKDDPAGLIAGETLRSQITAIEQSVKNSNRASNVISTADSALGEIGGLLNQVRGLVQEGLNSGALSQEEIAANQSQIDAALSAINRIAANTTFAGSKLLDGSKAFTTAISTADQAKLSDFNINEALFGSSPTIDISAEVVSAATKGELRYSGGNLSAAANIEVSGSRGSQVLFLGGSSTVSNIRDAINSVSDVTGVSASITNAAPGSLTVSNATAATLQSQNSTPGELTLTTAGSINITRNARAGFTQVNSGANDAVLTFSDARATTTVGDAAALGGQIFVQMVNGNNGDANSAVSSVDVDANGAYTVTIELADDGNGNSTATVANIQAAIAAHSGASGLISAASTGNAGATYNAMGAPAQLTGGQDTTNNDVSFADVRPVANRGDYNVAVAFVDPQAASQALSLNIVTNEFGDRTVNINLATDANGNITSTATQIAALVNGDANASVLLSATASGTGAGVVQANSAVALSDVTNSNLTFTDGRATDADATFTNNLSVVFANAGANQTLSAAFAANGDGGTLTVNLATDANGNITSTANDIKNLISNHANASIKNNFLVEASGDGTGTVQAFASQNLTGGSDGANNDLTFTDARATNSQGEFATTISTQFLNTGANQALGVTVSQDANGNHTITVNLATDANGNVTSTAGSIENYLTNSTDAGAVAARALVSVDASGDGTGVYKAKSLATLSGGSNGANNDVTFTDVRTGTQTQGIQVAFANAGANQTLGVSVGLDGNGNHLITVNLATDANGNVTSTAAQVANFIANDGSSGAAAARALVSAQASGNGTGTVAARTAAGLTASSGGDILVLKSSEFGSNEFVQVNVLSGSFATTLADNTTASSRDAGSDIAVRINGQDTVGKGLQASVKTATLDASLTFKEANNAAGQSATITITGGGSLFQIGQEASAAGQIGIGLEAVNTARLGGVAGKLYELGTGGGKSLQDVGPNVQGSDLVDIVEQAINKVSALRGRLGAIQKNVIETNVNSLGVALENITEARSSIVDADFASETANLTKAQILSQAGISVLGIANQAPSQVLSLLG